jgi:retron-type reverse transcriptase
MKVNDVVGRYFQTCKGVRQGDPLSPILFNLTMDVLAKLIDRARVNGQIKGIVPHLVDDGLSILQCMRMIRSFYLIMIWNRLEI